MKSAFPSCLCPASTALPRGSTSDMNAALQKVTHTLPSLTRRIVISSHHLIYILRVLSCVKHTDTLIQWILFGAQGQVSLTLMMYWSCINVLSGRESVNSHNPSTRVGMCNLTGDCHSLILFLCAGEKQAATHVSLDQEYDQDLAVMWCHLEEQLVAAANRGIVPVNFQPTQYCLNSQTDNLRHPLAVMEGKS